MPLTGKEMVKLLEKHGFKIDRTAGSHNIMKNGEGKAVSVPFSSKDLKKGTEHAILKQTGVKRGK